MLKLTWLLHLQGIRGKFKMLKHIILKWLLFRHMTCVNSTHFVFLVNGFEPLLVTDEHSRYDNRSYNNAQSSIAPRSQGRFNQSANMASMRHPNMLGNSRMHGGDFQGGDRTNHHGQRRQFPRENRRNWGNPPQARQFHGNCFICGNQGHYARNCIFSQH